MGGFQSTAQGGSILPGGVAKVANNNNWPGTVLIPVDSSLQAEMTFECELYKCCSCVITKKKST